MKFASPSMRWSLMRLRVISTTMTMKSIRTSCVRESPLLHSISMLETAKGCGFHFDFSLSMMGVS
ncbi:hypothetical protein Plhal703r1_c19g0085331 [Plasmopara halstedii]